MTYSEFNRIERLAEQRIRDASGPLRLPVDVLDVLVSNGVREDELARIVGPRAVPAVAPAGDLTPDQSEKVARLVHVVGLAERVFGSSEKAFFWLRSPSAQLNGRLPIAYLEFESGARFVEEMLVQIDHGMVA